MLFKTKEYIPDKIDDCLICNLEQLDIAEFDKEKLLNIRNELTAVCPLFKQCMYVFLN